ncbi:MAG: hypothetical protein E3J87_01300 [Candidatus Cloacimonadota bacterium]|nr:MAG: hypothetical protein E3J87_01300 [Candidatus Cloacimonadota bacterium]
MIKNKRNFILLMLIAIISLGGCKDCGTAPPLGPPDTEIIYPENGDTLSNALIKFEWKGLNNPDKYCYKLDEETWSGWTKDTTAEFFLDEGSHTFTAKARNKMNSEDKSPAVCSFYIDAIKGPALWIKNRKTEAPVSLPCSIKVYAENVTNLMLGYIKLMYENSKIKIGSIIADTTFLTKNGGEIQIIPEFNDSLPYLEVTIGVVGGEPKGVSGTGSLFTINFLLKVSDSTEIAFSSETEIRDTLNNPIPLDGGMWSCSIIPE